MRPRPLEGHTRDRARRTVGRFVALLTVVSLGVSGCSQGDSDGATSTERSATAVQTEAAEGTAEKAAHEAPDRACDGVQTLFSHLRTQSLGWKPEQRPFDPKMAAAVRDLAQGLAAEGRDASTQPVRAQVAATVTALDHLGVAMAGGKDAAGVLAAVSDTRVKYAALKAACEPGGTSSAEPSTRTPRTPPPSPKQKMPGPTCREVQGVMTTLGADLATWSPESDPFDKATASKWRAFGDQLAALAPRTGSVRIRAAIEENADAFTDIADAMGSRRRAAVKDAIRKAGLAYLDLHRECSLS